MKGNESPLPAARERLMRLPGLKAPLRLLQPPSLDACWDAMDPSAPDAEERIPYWAELWPSADGMARWLLAGGGPARPGRALEIGCGLGLVGLVALRLGWDIRLGDRDPEACRWAARNLALNGQDPRRVLLLDWRQAPAQRFDTLLASDVLYERGEGEILARYLAQALAPRGRAFIAEPLRPVAEPALALLAREFHLRSLPARARVDGRWRRLHILELRRRHGAQAPGFSPSK